MGTDVSSGPGFLSKKRGGLAVVSSGLVFLKKKKKKSQGEAEVPEMRNLTSSLCYGLGRVRQKEECHLGRKRWVLGRACNSSDDLEKVKQ